MTGGDFGGNKAAAAKRSQSDFNLALAPKFGDKKTARKNDLLSGIIEEDD